MAKWQLLPRGVSPHDHDSIVSNGTPSSDGCSFLTYTHLNPQKIYSEFQAGPSMIGRTGEKQEPIAAFPRKLTGVARKDGPAGRRALWMGGPLTSPLRGPWAGHAEACTRPCRCHQGF